MEIDLRPPCRVLIKELGPCLILERLTDDTFVCAYEAGGIWRYAVQSTGAIVGSLQFPKVLEELERLEKEKQGPTIHVES